MATLARGVVLFFFFMLISCAAAPAGEGDADPPNPERPPGEALEPLRTTKPYGFRRLGRDARYLVGRPFNLDRKSRNRALAVGGATVGLYLFRDEIRDWAQDHGSTSRSEFLSDVRTMGKGAVAPSLALVAYASSFLTRNEREKETAQLLLESAAFSAVTAVGGQFVLTTERPESGDSIRFFDDQGHGVSLDAALAASIVPPLRCQYLRVRPSDSRARRFWKRTATVLLYSGAVLTAYQRIDADKHWAPDAFLGTMTGLAIGSALCRAHDEPPGVPSDSAPADAAGPGGARNP